MPRYSWIIATVRVKHQSINQSINQSTNQSINQSTFSYWDNSYRSLN